MVNCNQFKLVPTPKKPKRTRGRNISVRLNRKLLYNVELIGHGAPLSAVLRTLIEAQLCRSNGVATWMDLPTPPDDWEPTVGTE